MSDERFTPKPRDYSYLRFDVFCTIEDLADIISTYQLEGADYESEIIYKVNLLLLKEKTREILHDNTHNNKPLKRYNRMREGYDEDGIRDLIKFPSIHLAEFATWAIEKGFKCPQEILDKCNKNTCSNDVVNKHEAIELNSSILVESTQDGTAPAIIDSVGNSPILPEAPPLEPKSEIQQHVEHVKEPRYSFIKIRKTWTIQFGDIRLDDLTDMIGMNYIKILLQRPHIEVGVIEIQAMLNPDINLSSRAKRSKDKLIDFKDEEDSPHPYPSKEPDTDNTSTKKKPSDISDDYQEEDTDSGDEYTEYDDNLEKLKNAIAKLPAEDKERVTTLYREIEAHKAKLEEARENNNTIEVSRLTGLVNIMREDMYDILNQRIDDPELDKNRKKVYKNIKDARDNIKTEEIAGGYEDTPVYKYLTEHLNTGYTCKYSPRDDDPIQWIL